MTPFEGHTGLTLILTCNKMATLNTLILVNQPEVQFSGFSVSGVNHICLTGCKVEMGRLTNPWRSPSTVLIHRGSNVSSLPTLDHGPGKRKILKESYQKDFFLLLLKLSVFLNQE